MEKFENMNEKFKEENDLSLEKQEDKNNPSHEALDEENRLYNELQEAMKERDRIMDEIDKVLESVPDRSEAEKIVLEKLAPSMDEIVKKESRLTTEWLESMKKSQLEESESNKQPSLEKSAKIETLKDSEEIKDDPRFKELLEKESLNHLKQNDKEYFYRYYSGEIAPSGYLIGKDGKETNSLPSQNIQNIKPIEKEALRRFMELYS